MMISIFLIAKRCRLCLLAIAGVLCLSACQSNVPAPVVDSGARPIVNTKAPAVWIDREIEGVWVIDSGELGGKPFAIPGFELTIKGETYAAGGTPPNDLGTLVYHHQQAATSFPGLDVVGVEGPNKGKRIPALYRLVDGKLEICYDLSQTARPTAFAAPAGSTLLRVIYRRK